MVKAGISLENVKINNKAAILEVLNKKGMTSRKDIASELGLTPAAVTMLCSELIEVGMLVEKGEVQEEKRAGRRKILIDINYDYRCIVAVNIEVINTYISIVNLKGELLSQKVIDTETRQRPESFLERIAGECKALLWEKEKNPSSVMGVGICLPGIVNRITGVSENANGVWTESVPVKKIMESFMNCPVIIENNIKAFAEGELLYGMGKTGRNLLFVKWGPGVGSAIVINNEIYEGMGRKAAEIGHCILESGEKRCRCGRKGCLETEVSITAITEKIKGIYSKKNTPLLYEMTQGKAENVTGEFFYDFIESLSGECIDSLGEKADLIIDDCIQRLARVVVNVITMLAPDSTVLFGCMLENENIRSRFIKACKSYDKSYDESYISKSVLSNKISYIGASTLIAREYFFSLGGLENNKK